MADDTDPYALAIGDTWDSIFSSIPGLKHRSSAATARLIKELLADEESGKQSTLDSIITPRPGSRFYKDRSEADPYTDALRNALSISPAEAKAPGEQSGLDSIFTPRKESRFYKGTSERDPYPEAIHASRNAMLPPSMRTPMTYSDPAAQAALAKDPALARAVGTPELFSKEEEAAGAVQEREAKPSNLRAIDAEIAKLQKSPLANSKQLAILQAERGNVARGPEPTGGTQYGEEVYGNDEVARLQKNPLAYSGALPQAGGAAGGAAPPTPETIGQKRINELRAEIQKLIGAPAQPLYSEEEGAARQEANQRMLQYGAIGQLANIGPTRALGKSLMAEALQNQRQKVTDHGLLDPLTGRFQFLPGVQEAARAKQLEAELGQLYKLEEVDALRRMGYPPGFDPKMLKKDEWLNPRTQQIEPLPGSELAIKQQGQMTTQMKATQNSANLAAEQSRVIDDLLKNETGLKLLFPGTGIKAEVTRRAAMATREGSAALASLTRLNSFFSQKGIQEMRANAGQSLGQMTEREWPIVAGLVGNLDGTVSAEEIVRVLSGFKAKAQQAAAMDRTQFQQAWKKSPFWTPDADSVGTAVKVPEAPQGGGWVTTPEGRIRLKGQ